MASPNGYVRELRARLRAHLDGHPEAAQALGGSFAALKAAGDLARALGARRFSETSGPRTRAQLCEQTALSPDQLELAGALLEGIDWPRVATATRKREEGTDHRRVHPITLRGRQGVLPARVARRFVVSADTDRNGPIEGADLIGPYRCSYTPRPNAIRLLSALGALHFTPAFSPDDGWLHFSLNQLGGAALERQIGWSDYTEAEETLLGLEEGEIEAECGTGGSGYSNEERWAITGPLVERLERLTADGRWLPLREARQVDDRLAEEAKRNGQRHPRSKLGSGATYRIRWPDWYRHDLETKGRRTFVASDTLRFLRGGQVRFYTLLQSWETSRYGKGPLKGKPYKRLYAAGKPGSCPMLFTLGMFDHDRERSMEQIHEWLWLLNEYEVGYERPRRITSSKQPGRDDFCIDVADGYGIREDVPDRKAPSRRARVEPVGIAAAAAQLLQQELAAGAAADRSGSDSRPAGRARSDLPADDDDDDDDAAASAA